MARASLDKAGKERLLKEQRQWLANLRQKSEQNLGERSIKSGLELMLSFRIYTLSHYALKERTKNAYFSTLRYDTNNLTTDAGSLQVGGKKFIIVVLRNWEDKDGTG